MNTFEQTIAKQKLILTRAVMILAGVVCFSLLAVVKMTALEEVLCSVLGVTVVCLSQPVAKAGSSNGNRIFEYRDPGGY